MKKKEDIFSYFLNCLLVNQLWIPLRIKIVVRSWNSKLIFWFSNWSRRKISLVFFFDYWTFDGLQGNSWFGIFFISQKLMPIILLYGSLKILVHLLINSLRKLTYSNHSQLTNLHHCSYFLGGPFWINTKILKTKIKLHFLFHKNKKNQKHNLEERLKYFDSTRKSNWCSNFFFFFFNHLYFTTMDVNLWRKTPIVFFLQ